MVDTDTLEPPKKSFTQTMAAARPKNEAELKAAAAAIAPPVQTPPPKPPEPPPQPATATAAPAASTDSDEEILSGKRTPKADDFKRVKTSAATFKAKSDEQEKELVELRKRPVHNAELIKKIEADRDSAASERDKFKTLYEGVALEFMPEFQTKYQKRLESATSGLKATLPADVADKVIALLSHPDSDPKRAAIIALSENLDQMQIAEIAAAGRDVRNILAERQSEIGKANENLNTIATERTNKAKERHEAMGKTFDSVLSKAQAKDGAEAIPTFQLREGDDAETKTWNEGVVERSKVARAVFTGQFDNDEEKAQAALWAASAPSFLRELSGTQAALKQANETIAKLQGANPGLNGGGGGEPPAKRGGFTEKMVKTAAI